MNHSFVRNLPSVFVGPLADDQQLQAVAATLAQELGLQQQEVLQACRTASAQEHSPPAPTMASAPAAELQGFAWQNEGRQLLQQRGRRQQDGPPPPAPPR